MSDYSDLTAEEAFHDLSNRKGQQYVHADWAHGHMLPFAAYATDGFLEENGNAGYRELVFAYALADEQTLSRDARGMTSTLPYKPIITVAQVTSMIVEAIGEEPSEYVAGGAGFTADGRHDRNVETIGDALDLGVVEEGE